MSSTPVPGSPVRGSTTGRPLMAALDLLGRRWALRLVWELRDQPVGARDLQRRCDGMSSSVLYQRLSELSDACLVEKDARGAYQLTAVGASLSGALLPLTRWATDWEQAQRGD